MYNIRNMTEQDVLAVQQVATDTWHTTYEGIIPRSIQDAFLQQAYNESHLSQRLQHGVFYVAETNGAVRGFAHFSPVVDGMVILYAIYIHPTLQGKGIGTAFLQKLHEEVDGVETIEVEVEQDNQIGMHFYKAKGFQVREIYEEDFDGHLLKTVKMYKVV